MFLPPGWDHGHRMHPLTITRVLSVGRPCVLSVTFKSAPEKFIIVRSMDETHGEVLAKASDTVQIGLEDGPSLHKLVFAGYEPTFGFELKCSFDQGAIRCRVRIIGSVDGTFRVTQENWTGDLARKGTVRISPRGPGPLLGFDFAGPAGDGSRLPGG